MTERFAIYYAPAAGSALWQRAEAWLAQADFPADSARRYGFHATLKAPMGLADGTDRAGLEMALASFARGRRAVALGGLAPRLIEGFLALTTEPQPPEVTEFAATVALEFEPFRAPLDPAGRERRLTAPLTPRQVELVDRYGYPYVLEQFQFHMTLTDRLPAARGDELKARATAWFAEALAGRPALDRLALFHEAAPGEPFRRLDDYVLRD